jgi:ferredoxin
LSYFYNKITKQKFKKENMVREMVRIDEALCDGCGLCVPGCHEGALQIIDGKARLISDLMCDGLGACIGHCPQGAITIEKREAGAYDEAAVVALMIPKGKNTMIAHLKHLKDHQEMAYLKEGVTYLSEHEKDLGFSLQEVIDAVYGNQVQPAAMIHHHGHGGGCPGSKTMTIERPVKAVAGAGTVVEETVSASSELRQWPVQMHLINPQAPYYRNSDVLLAADCVAYAMGDFHQRYLKGKSVAIACPKLDANTDVYLNKITAMIDYANINTITVMIMQVPCCGGLLQIVKQAVSAAQRKIPVKLLMVSLEGKVINEEWQ